MNNSVPEIERSSADIAKELQAKLDTIPTNEVVDAITRTYICSLRDALNAAELKENNNDLDALMEGSPYEDLYAEATQKSQLPKPEKVRSPKFTKPRIGECGTLIPGR